MPSYRAPVEDVLFLLNDVFHIARLNNLPGFAEASPDVVAAMLEEAGRFCSQILAPLNKSGDVQGCSRDDQGRVTTPGGFKSAYRQWADGGWVGLSCPEEFGGQGLPATLTTLINEFLGSANLAFSLYPALTQGAIAAILAHGSDEQKQLFLPKLVSGRWAGTMNLTEPQSGSDLGLLRTKAVKQADGSYRISGSKIFISGGEQDLTENIVHLVLARIEGAPAGTEGISLFIAPKVLVRDDGSLGERNAVSCLSLEHKMGIHGNATCAMNYDNATGFLLGVENRGLSAMFTMMNEARVAVGVQGLALSEVAGQNAAAYARERLQGRALSGAKYPDRAADPIVVHPDVRRMLMNIRAFNEAARALVVWTSLYGDIARRSSDAAQRQHASDMMELLTPVVKGVLTEAGFANAVAAQQVFGGHGYIVETGIEQFVRDARIPMIYEGTNGIQALDLIGRKLPKDGGRALQAFFAEVAGFLKDHKDDETLKPYLAPLETALGHLQQASLWLMQNAFKQPDHAGAAAHDYMHLLGLVAMGLMWARMVVAAQEKLAADAGAREQVLKSKLILARFFMERMLPETAAHLARIAAGADTVMALKDEEF